MDTIKNQDEGQETSRLIVRLDDADARAFKALHSFLDVRSPHSYAQCVRIDEQDGHTVGVATDGYCMMVLRLTDKWAALRGRSLRAGTVKELARPVKQKDRRIYLDVPGVVRLSDAGTGVQEFHDASGFYPQWRTPLHDAACDRKKATTQLIQPKFLGLVANAAKALGFGKKAAHVAPYVRVHVMETYTKVQLGEAATILIANAKDGN